MIGNIQRAQIWEDIYYPLFSRVRVPAEQKGCCRGTRETDDLLYVDQTIKIYSEYKGMEFNIKIDHAFNEKWTKQILEGVKRGKK